MKSTLKALTLAISLMGIKIYASPESLRVTVEPNKNTGPGTMPGHGIYLGVQAGFSQCIGGAIMGEDAQRFLLSPLSSVLPGMGGILGGTYKFDTNITLGIETVNFTPGIRIGYMLTPSSQISISGHYALREYWFLDEVNNAMKKMKAIRWDTKLSSFNGFGISLIYEKFFVKKNFFRAQLKFEKSLGGRFIRTIRDKDFLRNYIEVDISEIELSLGDIGLYVGIGSQW